MNTTPLSVLLAALTSATWSVCASLIDGATAKIRLDEKAGSYQSLLLPNCLAWHMLATCSREVPLRMTKG